MGNFEGSKFKMFDRDVIVSVLRLEKRRVVHVLFILCRVGPLKVLASQATGEVTGSIRRGYTNVFEGYISSLKLASGFVR